MKDEKEFQDLCSYVPIHPSSIIPHPFSFIPSLCVVLQSRGDMGTFDVIVIGGGVMGAATACEVARQGVNVALMDQARLPNPLAASVDHSKVFRFAYPDALYAQMAVDALARWQRLEQESGARLLTETGLLMLASRSSTAEAQSYET